MPLYPQQIREATGARPLTVIPAGRAGVRAVCTNSRQISSGCLFVALRGERFDGHDFLAEAAAGRRGGRAGREAARRSAAGPAPAAGP